VQLSAGKQLKLMLGYLAQLVIEVGLILTFQSNLLRCKRIAYTVDTRGALPAKQVRLFLLHDVSATYPADSLVRRNLVPA